MSDETHEPERKLPAAQHAGAVLHMVMWERRIRQTDLAARVGMSQSTLSKKLRGEVPITVDELVQLAHAVGVSVCALLEEDTAPSGDHVVVPAGWTAHLRRHQHAGAAS